MGCACWPQAPGGTWEDRLPYLKELPCVPVATAPAMLWSMYQGKAGSV